ncbi:DNA excision repair protein ERCC-3 [Halobaculum gomorrense]|uniref:DNA 3'-5' helicase n=2 Tax=Halobaculum gomorrense TaxID=43928 RepID=A0A1M5URZ7_9EURY|nr:DNA excision repair protein ERCC-3 [Halobaculum gomorrense]
MPKNTQYPLEDVRESVFELLSEQPFVTTGGVAKAHGMDSETARLKLNKLVEQDTLKTRQIGASARVWFSDANIAPEQILQKTAAEGSAPEQMSERTLFFPSRREIVVDSPQDETRDILSRVAHLVDSTGSGFLYKIDQEDIWTAAYDTFDTLRSDLQAVVGDEWTASFESRIRDDWDRAHQFRLRTRVADSNQYSVLEADDQDLFESVAKANLDYNTHYTEFLSETAMRIKNGAEASVKEVLYEEGYPVLDERRLKDGASLEVQLGDEFDLREYQQRWVDQFAERRAGVFVGPSGSGKTVAAIGAMEAIGGETLIIVPSRELAQQWVTELTEKTNLDQSQIGQYHGGQKEVRPVTIATYDIAAMKRHRELFNERDWGLVIADECHHAVASTWKRFREIQSTARLGLSATPVRESGDAKEIYTLIGPPIGSDWRELFEAGWVSQPEVEMRLVGWESESARDQYKQADGTQKLIEAARNPAKQSAISDLLERHSGEKALIFADWIEQGKDLSNALNLPFIYGETSHERRESIYQQFRDGDIEALIVSRVGDEGIDLPDAEVAILASTMGSSRSQTGQRAGRTMRPFGDAAVYLLLTKGTGEEEWGRESTQYLAEKGVSVQKTGNSDSVP